MGKYGQKTEKLADVTISAGRTMQVIRDNTKTVKPYHVYLSTFEGGDWHKRKLTGLDSLTAAVKYIAAYVEVNENTNN